MPTINFYLDPGLGSHDVTVDVIGEGDSAPDDRFVFARSASIGDGASAGLRWTLEPITSQHVDRLTAGRLIDIYVFRATDVAAIAAFDRRITEPYTRMCAELGEYNAGSFLCAELGEPWIVELSTWDSDDPAEVQALVERQTMMPIPVELKEIVDECRTYQQRDTTRYSLRLLPR